MYKECRHIMPSGSKCKSPALRESAFCYYHVNVRRSTGPRNVFDDIKLPPLEDNCGVQIALSEVLGALVASRIDARRAGLLLYGLQIAAQINRRSGIVLNPVRSIEHDTEGNALAPEKTACEPPEDCTACPNRDHCDTYQDYEDDEEEEVGPDSKLLAAVLRKVSGCAEENHAGMSQRLPTQKPWPAPRRTIPTQAES
jgi:hypothetical protein